MLAAVAVLCGLVGIAAAAMVYLRGKGSARAIERTEFAHGWYIDEAYSWFMGGPGRRFFEAVSWFDRTVIDGVVNGVAAGVSATGSGLRLAQTGRVRNSAIGIAAGTVAVLVYVVVRMSV